MASLPVFTDELCEQLARVQQQDSPSCEDEARARLDGWASDAEKCRLGRRHTSSRVGCSLMVVLKLNFLCSEASSGGNYRVANQNLELARLPRQRKRAVLRNESNTSPRIRDWHSDHTRTAQIRSCILIRLQRAHSAFARGSRVKKRSAVAPLG